MSVNAKQELFPAGTVIRVINTDNRYECGIDLRYSKSVNILYTVVSTRINENGHYRTRLRVVSGPSHMMGQITTGVSNTALARSFEYYATTTRKIKGDV